VANAIYGHPSLRITAIWWYENPHFISRKKGHDYHFIQRFEIINLQNLSLHITAEDHNCRVKSVKKRNYFSNFIKFY
jgi:hypothetical protein